MEKEKEVKISYEVKKGDLVFEGHLPDSALAQFDLYTALLAYWNDKTPQTWSTVKAYILANSKVTDEKSGLELDIAKDLNFGQVKFLIEQYMSMAADFFTSPQSQAR